jgi:hypothetical protein
MLEIGIAVAVCFFQLFIFYSKKIPINLVLRIGVIVFAKNGTAQI